MTYHFVILPSIGASINCCLSNGADATTLPVPRTVCCQGAHKKNGIINKKIARVTLA
jgi:hypothetical protein